MTECHHGLIEVTQSAFLNVKQLMLQDNEGTTITCRDAEVSNYTLLFNVCDYIICQTVTVNVVMQK